MNRDFLLGIGEFIVKESKKLRCDFVDFRFKSIYKEHLSMLQGNVQESSDEFSEGYSIRVLKKGNLGFASNFDLRMEGVLETLKKASSIAEANYTFNRKEKIFFDPLPPVEDHYETPVKINPQEWDLKRKIDFLTHVTDVVRNLDRDVKFEIHLDIAIEERFFMSSEGRIITQKIIKTGSGSTLTVFEGNERITLTYPPTSSGQYETCGLELLDELDYINQLPRVVKELMELKRGKKIDDGVYDVIMDGTLISLIIHESIGHALEMDRVFGSEASFSGTTYATLDKLNKLRIGSEKLNIVVDGRTPRGLATCFYDDEGVETKREYLIKEGILTGYLTSREFAHILKRPSTGSCFSQDWMNLPLIRITNVNLLPGSKKLEEIIAGVDEGVFLKGVSSWSIDDERLNFHFKPQIGYIIKGGKLREVIKPPTFKDNTLDFWKKLEEVAGPMEWRIWGTPNCGKGEPGQTIGTAQGASPCLFKKISLSS